MIPDVASGGEVLGLGVVEKEPVQVLFRPLIMIRLMTLS